MHLITSLILFGVRFGDFTTALFIVLLVGGSDMRKQSPTSTKMAASIERYNREQDIVSQ